MVFIFRLLIPCGMVTRLISRSRHALMSLLTPLVTVEEEDDGNVDSMTATAATEGFGGY